MSLNTTNRWAVLTDESDVLTDEWKVSAKQKRGKKPTSAEKDVPAVKSIAPEPVALSEVQVKQTELEQKLDVLEAMRVKLQAQLLNVEKDVRGFHIQLAETAVEIECAQQKILNAMDGLKLTDNFPKLSRRTAPGTCETPPTELKLREQTLIDLKTTRAQLQENLAATEEANHAIQIQLADIDADRVRIQKLLLIGTGAKPVVKTGVSFFKGCSSGPITLVQRAMPRTSKQIGFNDIILQLVKEEPTPTKPNQFGTGQQHTVYFPLDVLAPCVVPILEKIAAKKLPPHELTERCTQAAKFLHGKRANARDSIKLPERFLLHLSVENNSGRFYTNPNTFGVTMMIYPI